MIINKPIFGFLALLTIFICVVFMSIFMPAEPNDSYQWLMITITLSSVVVFMLCHEKFIFFSFSFIFMVGFLIVFDQVLWLKLIGYPLPSYNYQRVWASESIENLSITISTLSLLAFLIGNILLSHKKSVTDEDNDLNLNPRSLVILTYVFYLMFFLTSGSYRGGDYSSIGALAVSSYFHKLFTIFLTASIIITLSNISKVDKKTLTLWEYFSCFGAPLLLIIFWNLLFSLFVGDRGVFITYALMISLLYFIRWNKIGIIKMFIFISLFSVIMAVIGEIRLHRHDGDSYMTRFNNAITLSDKRSVWYETKVPLDSTVELAHSVRTLNHALLNIPENYDYGYGLFMGRQVISVIPGLNSMFNKLVYDGDTKYGGTASFISFLIQGEHRTYGDGTSIVADLYMDFGIIGAVIVMFIFGCFTGSAEKSLHVSSFACNRLSVIAMIIFFSKALYLSRSSISLEVSNIVMVWVVINILAYFSSVERRKLN